MQVRDYAVRLADAQTEAAKQKSEAGRAHEARDRAEKDVDALRWAVPRIWAL